MCAFKVEKGMLDQCLGSPPVTCEQLVHNNMIGHLLVALLKEAVHLPERVSQSRRGLNQWA